MGSMQKPPSGGGVSKEKQMQKKEEERLKKIQDEDKRKIREFRTSIEKKIETFMADDAQHKLVFAIMEKHSRAIVHDVIDIAGLLTAYSFGIDDVDRHVVAYKEGFEPSEDELIALRRGEPYDPEKIRREKEFKEDEERERQLKRKKEKIVPKNDYSEKYEHLIGRDAGISAAKVTGLSASFGLVPSANKRDQRSIEQTLADMRKKKQKTDDLSTLSSTSVKDNDDDDEEDN